MKTPRTREDEKLGTVLILDGEQVNSLRPRSAEPGEPIPVTLAQLLMGEIAIPAAEPGGEKPTVSVRVLPVTMNGLAMLEREFGGVENIPNQSSLTVEQTITIVRCLMNDRLPKGAPLYEQTEVGRLLDGTRIAVISRAIEDALNPLAEWAVSRTQATTAQTGTPDATVASAGEESSGSVSSTSASEAPTSSVPSPTAG